MKKVLLIGYPFPLRRLGSPRLLGLAKYLPEFGWEPIILTAPIQGKADSRYRIVETGYREAASFWRKLLRLNPESDLRKQIKRRLGVTKKESFLDSLLTLAGEIINYPDSEKCWKPYAVKTSKELLEKEKIDAIISTSAPLTTHIIARELKSIYKIPWAADLRDLWTQNHNYSYGSLRKMIDKRLELKTLGAADALVTVSHPWAYKLSTLHKNKKIYAITNGFDPDMLNIPPEPLTKKFTITYTGRIYTGKTDPTRFFQALKELVIEGNLKTDDVEVRFYGLEMNWMTQTIQEYGLSDIVKHYGPTSQQDAIKKQRESHLLLLLNWEDEKERGWHPLKGFEYLAAVRPILSIGGSGDDVTKALLDETKAGVYCRTVEAVKKAIMEFYTEYKKTGKVNYFGDIIKINKYSHREMARKYSEVLEQITGGRK